MNPPMVSLLEDVCYYAKVRILKQITTWIAVLILKLTMFVIMQR